jgi:hypothetical protein
MYMWVLHPLDSVNFWSVDFPVRSIQLNQPYTLQGSNIDDTRGRRNFAPTLKARKSLLSLPSGLGLDTQATQSNQPEVG